MRKAAPLLLMLMTLSSLPAQSQVLSNSIGQDRGRFLEESGYSLRVEGNESTLYHQDEPVWKETIVAFEGGWEVTTYHYKEGLSSLQRYEDTRLVLETEGPESLYFYYDESGLLEKTITLLDEKLSEMELYTYDVRTKSLNSILTITQKGSSTVYFGDPIIQPWFSYTKDATFSKVVQITENLQVQEVWEGDTLIQSVAVEMPQEGGMRLSTTKKGVQESELYNDEGLLTLRTTPSLTTEYTYDEGRVIIEAVERKAGNNVRTIRYEKGRVVSESIEIDEILEKVISYPKDSGKVETLYDSGIPYCDVTYALDGMRVLSIRYR